MPRRRSKWNILAQIAGGAGKALLERWQAEQEYGRLLGLEKAKAQYDNVERQFQKGQSDRLFKNQREQAATAAQVARDQATLEAGLDWTGKGLEEDRPSAQAATGLANARAKLLAGQAADLDFGRQVQKYFLPDILSEETQTSEGDSSPSTYIPSDSLDFGLPGDLTASPDVNVLDGLGGGLKGIFDGSPLQIGAMPDRPVFDMEAAYEAMGGSPYQGIPTQAATGSNVDSDKVISVAGKELTCGQLEGLRAFATGGNAAVLQEIYEADCPRPQARRTEEQIRQSQAEPQEVEWMTASGGKQVAVMPRGAVNAFFASPELPPELNAVEPQDLDDPLAWQIAQSELFDAWAADNIVIPFDASASSRLSEIPQLRNIVRQLTDSRDELWLPTSDVVPRLIHGAGTQWEMLVSRSDPTAAAYKAILDGYVAALAGVGGEGANRLSDQDILRARTLIPRSTDSRAVADILIAQLNRAVSAMQRPLLGLEGPSVTDVLNEIYQSSEMATIMGAAGTLTLPERENEERPSVTDSLGRVRRGSA
jgi:hypothetical protein